MPQLTLSKRPPLIWFTQTLILFFALLFALFLAAELVALPQLKETYRNAIWAIVEAVSIHTILLVSLVLLFVGLVRRRRWAWWGSIVFAACMLALLVASRLHPSGPIPILPIPPEQLLGAGIAEVARTLAGPDLDALEALDARRAAQEAAERIQEVIKAPPGGL